VKLFIILFLLISFNAFASGHCEKETIRYFVKGSFKEEQLKICYADIGVYPVLMSEDCFKDGKCVALRMKSEKGDFRLNSTVGNPSFSLCRALHGTPQLFEIKKKNGEWHKTDRCIFEDSSFVEADYLVYLHKKNIEEIH